MTYISAADIITIHFTLEKVIKTILKDKTNAARKPVDRDTPTSNDLLGEIQYLQDNTVIKRHLKEITDDKGEHTWQE